MTLFLLASKVGCVRLIDNAGGQAVTLNIKCAMIWEKYALFTCRLCYQLKQHDKGESAAFNARSISLASIQLTCALSLTD